MKRRWISVLLFCVMMAVPFLFQNCGAPPMGEEDPGSSGPLATTFAYDSTVDHLAYMSCSSMQAPFDSDSFFTFKAGAYESGNGIRLSNAFLSSSSNLTLSEKVLALQNSPLNSGVYYQIGIRKNQAFQTMLSGTGSFGDFVGSLSSTSNANTLTSLAKNVRATVVGGAKFEDKSQFVQVTEVAAQGIRQELTTGTSLVSLAYSNENGSPANAIAPSPGSNTSVYGTGFTMSFRRGHAISTAGVISNFTVASPRVMENVREFSLETGLQSSNVWDCPSDWSFMIVRAQDQATYCTDASDNPTPTNTAQQTALTELRKMLPAANWSVSLSRRCVVAKLAGNCYGSINAINYAGAACDSTTGNCPHYVTICKKR